MPDYQDPRWQRKRLEVFDRDKWTCQRCFSTDSTLHVHHRYYTNGAHQWEYPMDAFVTYCAQCHADVESRLYKIFEQFLGDLEGRMTDVYDKKLSRLIDCIQFILDNTESIPEPKSNRVIGGTK